MSEYSKPSLTPSELANQIRLFLAEKRGGQPAARLAWRFSRAIENAKLDSDEIVNLIRNRNLVEAFLLANAEPTIAEVIGELTLPEATNWKSECEQYHRCIHSNLDPQIVSEFSDSFPAKRDRDEWLLDEYRSRKEAGDITDAYPIIRFLAKQPSSNSAITEEHTEIKSVIIQRASAQIAKLLKQDVNSSLIAAELDYFRSYDLDITSDLGPVFENALSIERTRQKVLALEKVQSFLESVDSSKLDGLSWIPHENLYFSYDGLITRQDLRWLLPKELIQNFSIYAEQLSELRLNFESSVKPKPRVIPVAPPVEKQEKPTAVTEKKVQIQVEEEHVQKAPLAPVAETVQETIPALETDHQKPENNLSKDELAIPKNIPAAETPENADPVEKSILPQPSAEIPPPVVVEQSATLNEVETVQPNIEPTVPESTEPEKAEATVDSKEKSSPYPRILYIGLPIGVAAAIAFFFLPGKTSRDISSKVEIQEPNQQTVIVEPKPVEPQIKYIEAAPYENTRYDEYVKNLTEILEGKLDHSRLVEMENLLSKIDNEILEMPIKEAEKRTVTFNSLVIASNAIRREFVSQLIEDSKQEYDAYNKSIELLTTSIGKEDFKDLVTRAMQARETQLKKIATIKQIDPQAGVPSLVGLDQAIDIAKRQNEAILQERESLMASRTIKEYFDKLDKLAALPNAPAEEIEKLAQAARLSGNVENAIIELRKIPIPAEVSNIITTLKDSVSGQKLEFVEKALLDNMVRVATSHSQVFEVKELYYKGKKTPYSEKIRLIQGRPHEAGDKTQITTDITLFDGNGAPSGSSVSKNYMIDQFDNPWGYKYTDQVQTAEAKFCESHILPKLETFTEQTDQVVVLKLVDDISQQTELSSDFRAYWTLKLFEFSAERKWHWGQALSQTFTDTGLQLEKLDRTDKGSWIKARLQSAPEDQKLEATMATLSNISVAGEAQAILALWDFSENCEFKPVGYVTKDGIPSFPQLSSDNEAMLWTVNRDSNEMKRLSESRASLPYSPILSAKRSDVDSSSFISQLSSEYGVDLKSERYKHLIPGLFHPNK